MSSDNSNLPHPPVDGVDVNVNESDVQMSEAPESNTAKTIRNVQTQHGDNTVDEGNVYLIPRCLWPHETISGKETTGPIATTSAEHDENAEQVVWIEPFADEVSFSNKRNCFETIKK